MIVSVKVFGLDLFDAPGVKIITDFRMKVFVKLYVMTILEWKWLWIHVMTILEWMKEEGGAREGLVKCSLNACIKILQFQYTFFLLKGQAINFSKL